MNPNPTIIVLDPTLMNDQEYILYAIYQHQVATVQLVVAAVIFFFIFKIAIWFIPKYWQRSEK